ncbi:MAG TPA: cobalamin-dependent protein, partial [Candidatus Saccharimonadales bacterium]|nr:cobalamin-dependent protein [Candidatus Saccharimonadales bacterium]
EDVDGIGISLLSGAHMTLFPEVLRLLRERGGEDIVVFGGGIVPPDDAVELKRMGVDEVFTPGTSIRDIIEYVERRFGLEKVPAGAR